MGNKIFKLPVPKYFKNFNIENRVVKELDKIEHTGPVVSPRHPSTAQLLKKIEESAPNVNEKEVNEAMVERSKKVTVHAKGGETEKEIPDKRPKKENEMLNWYDDTRKKDIDFVNYGYMKPDKIRPGHLTLRQFDQILNDYQSNKNAQTLNNFAAANSLDVNNLNTLVQYFKPLFRIDKENSKEKETALNEIFPNLRLNEKPS